MQTIVICQLYLSKTWGKKKFRDPESGVLYGGVEFAKKNKTKKSLTNPNYQLA